MYFANVPKMRAMPFGARRFVLAENFMAPIMHKIATAYLANKMDEAIQWEMKYNQVMVIQENFS